MKKRQNHHHQNCCRDRNDDHCVCKTVKKIVAAQNEVADRNHCELGCEQSVRDLLKPGQRDMVQHTAIPFILHCKGTCKAFIAEGVLRAPIEGYPEDKWYKCVKTPFLRAKKFVKGSDCCVVVELLEPCNANGMPLHHEGHELEDFLCCNTPKRTIQFRDSGVCLTLDLKDFSSIQCLDPATPLPHLNLPC